MSLPYPTYTFEKVKNMKKSKKNKNKQRFDFKHQIIERQASEIDNLKEVISKLEIGCSEKDEIINSIDDLRNDLIETIDDLKSKKNEYDRLIMELSEMRNVINQTVFKGRWKIIKLLIK